MAQLNLNLNPEFEENLKRFMRARKIKNKSEAIRIAVKEGLERAMDGTAKSDFRKWIGAGKKEPLNPSPTFSSEDDLW